MRVRNLTLTTASAAALTIGLASPALAAAVHSDASAGLHHRAQHVAVYPGAHQALRPAGVHAPGLVRGGDDDDDGDGRGGDGLDPCVAGGCFGGNNNNGGGIAPWAAFGDDGDGGGGGGNGTAGGSVIGGAPGGGGGFGQHRETVKKIRARAMGAPGRPAGVGMVPSGPVRTGFGGAQGSSVPLGLAGLTLLLGGTTLLARRRIRTGVRS
ncbi:hypothetical protein [Actinoallomurus rhizosphaericola]|uniref:hypothetical protein n=1 Tax=Actinoallomurus rhizosphaericola TaxID=2952536 RepID=UPI002091627E|nr:hypothetical protein [Actinoallomurus rhizosphaericola]MCO5994090.1 hypothetical protein [Actinoallomurus rhizosphaericola]